MSHLPTLITDLALILASAGLMTPRRRSGGSIRGPDIQASETTVGIRVYRGRYSCRTAYHVNPDGYRQRKYSDLGRYRGGIPVVCFGIGIPF